MPKPAKRVTAAKVAKPKMMSASRLAEKLFCLGRYLDPMSYESRKWVDAPAGSAESRALAKRMIACADALYKAAGVR